MKALTAIDLRRLAKRCSGTTRHESRELAEHCESTNARGHCAGSSRRRGAACGNSGRAAAAGISSASTWRCGDGFRNRSGAKPPEGPLDARGAATARAGRRRKASAIRSSGFFSIRKRPGLAGGTGTYPFLIGIAWWDAGGLEVEQFFMREHSEEHSVLVALAERMAERRVLVTFNGKSFDWPLLETRYRMTRKIRVPSPRAHLDFLHPARNLWRLRLGSARLPELEKHVLGWNRGADVMSELIPQIYFDYLARRLARAAGADLPPQPDGLARAGGAGEPDACGAGRSGRARAGRARAVRRVADLRATRRDGARNGRFTSGRSQPSFRRKPTARRSDLWRGWRNAKGDHALACELWEKMLGDSREGFEAYEQLAIHYERRAREPHRAAELVRKALAELRRANRLGMIAATAYRQKMRTIREDGSRDSSAKAAPVYSIRYKRELQVSEE